MSWISRISVRSSPILEVVHTAKHVIGICRINAEVELRDMLLDDVRKELRIRHYSHRTEEAYVGWIRRFIIFNGKRHPEEMGES